MNNHLWVSNYVKSMIYLVSLSEVHIITSDAHDDKTKYGRNVSRIWIWKYEYMYSFTYFAYENDVTKREWITETMKIKNIRMKHADNRRLRSIGIIPSKQRATLQISKKCKWKVKVKKVSRSREVNVWRYLPSGFLMFIRPELCEWSSWSESVSHQDTFTEGASHTFQHMSKVSFVYAVYIRYIWNIYLSARFN